MYAFIRIENFLKNTQMFNRHSHCEENLLPQERSLCLTFFAVLDFFSGACIIHLVNLVKNTNI